MDPFVVYNSYCKYRLLRDVLKEAPYSGKVDELSEATKVS